MMNGVKRPLNSRGNKRLLALRGKRARLARWIRRGRVAPGAKLKPTPLKASNSKVEKKLKTAKAMKATKVFIQGKKMRNVWPYPSKWQVIKYHILKFLHRVYVFFRLGAKILTYSVIAVSLINIGMHFSTKTIVKEIEVIREVEASSVSPVLARIAKCESNNQHFENGQVLVRGNTNGSVDVGRYQINISYWGKKATELGINLFDEQGNETFAKWLESNHGTEPWVWSKHCWNK
jgi:hypothetical protein